MLDHIKAHQAEINKRVRSIYGPSHIQYVEKSEVGDELEKGAKSLPIGAISNGYKKIAEGKWRKVSQQAMTKEEHLANSNPKAGGSHVHKKIADTLDDKEYSDDEVMKKPKAADTRKKHSVSVTKDNSMGGEAPGEYHYHARSQFEAEGMHMRKYGSKDASKVTSDSHNAEYETKLKKGEDLDEVGEALEKGHKSMPIGTISHGYKKIAEGKWKKVVDGTYSTKQEYIDRANEHIAIGKEDTRDYMRKLYEKDGKKALREAAKADDNDYDDDHVDRHAEEKKKKEDDEKKEKAARAAAASPEENLESLKAALKKRFKDSESEEHHDNVESSLKAYFKSLGIPGAMVDKEPFMEDEMFGGGEHNSVAQTIKHVKNMAQDMLKNKVEKGDNFNYHGAYEHQQLIKAQIANSFK